MKNFILIRAQIALFFKDRQARPDEFATELGQLVVSSQPPLIIPVPDRQELDMASVVQIRNEEMNWQIARKRADFIIQGKGEQTFEDVENSFVEKAEEFFSFLKETKSIKIARVGFVVEVFVKETDTVSKISRGLDSSFKNLIEGELREANIRLNKKIVLSEESKIELNNVVIVEKKKATLLEEDISHEGVSILRDFNTLPENDYSAHLSVNHIKDLIAFGKTHLNLNKIENILWTNG